MKLHFAIGAVALMLAACTPKDEGLAGPKPDDSELAGGTPVAELVLSGMINLKPPAGAHIVNDCEKIIAPDYDKPPKLTCAYFLDDKAVDDGAIKTVSLEATEAWMKAMDAAGWKFAHLAVIEHYFERARPGSECSDIAVLVSMQGEELKALVAKDPANGAYEGRPWRGYTIPASLGEACGADRKVR